MQVLPKWHRAREVTVRIRCEALNKVGVWSWAYIGSNIEFTVDVEGRR